MNKKIPTKSERKKKLQETCEIMRGEGLICDIGCNATEIWLRVIDDGRVINGRGLMYRPDVVAPAEDEIVIMRSECFHICSGFSTGEIINSQLGVSYLFGELAPMEFHEDWFCPANQTGSDGWEDWVPERFIKNGRKEVHNARNYPTS